MRLLSQNDIIKFGLNRYSTVATKLTEVNLSVFVYRRFHEDFFPIVGTNLDGLSTISMPYIQQIGRDFGWIALIISYPS